MCLDMSWGNLIPGVAGVVSHESADTGALVVTAIEPLLTLGVRLTLVHTHLCGKHNTCKLSVEFYTFK